MDRMTKVWWIKIKSLILGNIYTFFCIQFEYSNGYTIIWQRRSFNLQKQILLKI